MSKPVRTLGVLIAMLTAMAVALGVPAVAGASGGPPDVGSVAAARTDLTDPVKKEIAMELVCSAENSSLDWRAQYGYIEDIGDGRGYTAGIIGFTSATDDMVSLIEPYTKQVPDNPLARFLPALRKVRGTASHAGLGSAFVTAWKKAARTSAFQRAQDDLRDRVYFLPAVKQGVTDGLSLLGQFVYYDAMVNHGQGQQTDSFGGIRRTAMKHARTPAQGGAETAYLRAFFKARVDVLLSWGHPETDRVTVQRQFVKDGNWTLRTPLRWVMYGDHYVIATPPKP
jgi:chitosanase